MFELVQAGKIPPSADEVAARAGVSASSVFRNFDGLDDLQRQAVDRFQERYAHLLTSIADGDVDKRVAGFVALRVDLYEQAGPLMRLARQRALQYDPMVAAVATQRSRLAEQTRGCFRAEIIGRTPADAADLVALIDTMTCPEAFEVMSSAHGRTRRQIARSWIIGVRALLDGWPDPTATSTRTRTSSKTSNRQ